MHSYLKRVEISTPLATENLDVERLRQTNALIDVLLSSSITERGEERGKGRHSGTSIRVTRELGTKDSTHQGNTRRSSVNPRRSGEFIDAASHKLQLLLSLRSACPLAISSSASFVLPGFVLPPNFYNQFLSLFISEKISRESRYRD